MRRTCGQSALPRGDASTFQPQGSSSQRLDQRREGRGRGARRRLRGAGRGARAAARSAVAAWASGWRGGPRGLPADTSPGWPAVRSWSTSRWGAPTSLGSWWSLSSPWFRARCCPAHWSRVGCWLRSIARWTSGSAWSCGWSRWTAGRRRGGRAVVAVPLVVVPVALVPVAVVPVAVVAVAAVPVVAGPEDPVPLLPVVVPGAPGWWSPCGWGTTGRTTPSVTGFRTTANPIPNPKLPDDAEPGPDGSEGVGAAGGVELVPGIPAGTGSGARLGTYERGPAAATFGSECRPMRPTTPGIPVQ